MFRSVSVPQALALVLIGVVVGAVLDAVVLPTAHSMRAERQPPIRIFTARQRDPEQFRKDSASQASISKRFAAMRHAVPAEVRRVQALSNCAISFEFRDTIYRAAKLFDVTAWDRLAPGTVVSRAMAYSESGFSRGDTATVVLPNVYCRDILVASLGTSVVFPPLLYSAQ
jgi:hypothetical protein